MIEHWSAGAGEVYIYTTDPAIHKQLMQFNRRFTVYSDRGGTYAWQHRLTNQKFKVFQRIVREGKSQNSAA
jgi:hypothetical protein